MVLKSNRHVNVTMDTTFISYSFPLPDSSGSVFHLQAIYHENGEQNTQPHPMVFRSCKLSHGNSSINTYVAMNPIGFSDNNTVMVYKAAVIATTVECSSSSTFSPQNPFFALKIADDPESNLMLKEEVEVTQSVIHGRHQNLLQVFGCFMDKQSGKFCVLIPFCEWSLRTIMKTRFPQGLPEDLILSVLRSVLNALKFLHGQHILHRDINAGHVYLCAHNRLNLEDPFLIKLGFEATVYEDDDGMETTYLPMVSLSSWAAAPEVYYGNESYSEKADIWLVGITALELAYGGLKVSNRNALEAMIKEIKLPQKAKEANKTFTDYVKKLLPLFFSSSSNECTEELLPPLSSSSSSLKSNVNVSDEDLVVPLLSSKDDDDVGDEVYCPFSESFTEMVMQCLAWDPEKRPSVDRLLLHPFFTNRNSLQRKDGQYFYDAFMEKTSSG